MANKKTLREDGVTMIIFKQIVYVDLSEVDEEMADEMINTLAGKVKKSLDDNLAASKWVNVPPELFH